MANLFRSFSRKHKYGAMAATATVPIVIFTGVYVAWGYASRAFKNNQPVLSKSASIGMLHGGKPALKRLLDYCHTRADAMVLDEATNELKTALGDAYPDFCELKRAVENLEMSGEVGEAVTMLETAFREARKQRKPQAAYEIEMSLVEMLIYKGDFEKALNCECLKDEEITDARRPLYKAIIYITLGNYEQAKKCWGDFQGIQRNLQWPPSLKESQVDTASSINDFKQFEKVVKFLKDDIHEAQKDIPYPRTAVKQPAAEDIPSPRRELPPAQKDIPYPHTAVVLPAAKDIQYPRRELQPAQKDIPYPRPPPPPPDRSRVW
ncbi:hypothetical protein I3760_09G121000 [Carya illinoinensis]|uniref:Uncharacterized protein n=1 Tax=Carya illinoinensis TaxID=32201 RepID=A0A922J5Z3_CARIL|nr:hypothetical protein I3760_09G121000 [Carya illinoinensis]KAG6695946.1 hypothetical protein I3842_09G122600 [Carya illinoinensis]